MKEDFREDRNYELFLILATIYFSVLNTLFYPSGS